MYPMPYFSPAILSDMEMNWDGMMHVHAKMNRFGGGPTNFEQYGMGWDGSSLEKKNC